MKTSAMDYLKYKTGRTAAEVHLRLDLLDLLIIVIIIINYICITLFLTRLQSG